MRQQKRSAGTSSHERAKLRAAAARVLPEVVALDERLRTLERSHDALLSRLDAERQASAKNLLHYLALRSADIRDLQDELAALGLSSLGRSEAHPQATVQ